MKKRKNYDLMNYGCIEIWIKLGKESCPVLPWEINLNYFKNINTQLTYVPTFYTDKQDEWWKIKVKVELLNSLEKYKFL